MASLRNVAVVLRYRDQKELADLLSRATVDFSEETPLNWYDGSVSQYIRATVHAPIDEYDRLVSLRQQENDEILGVIQELWPAEQQESGLPVSEVIYRLDQSSLQERYDNVQESLLRQLDDLRTTLIGVATGGPRIDDVNARYKESYFRLTEELRILELVNPIPYADLWDWYGKWRGDPELGSYRSRRQFIRNLCEPLEKNLREMLGTDAKEVFRDATGWSRVDHTLGRAIIQLRSASVEAQFQEVGLLCREALISLAQAVYDANRHASINENPPSQTDAKQMLESYLDTEARGKSNYSARRLAKVAVDLANEVQHKRTAEFRDAALCAQATTSVVNIIAIISGIRDPQ